MKAKEPYRARAGRPRSCDACGGPIEEGAVYWRRVYRERALSHHEAAHAGSLYPIRIRRACLDCGPGATR